MRKMIIFDPAMCCSTGICGVGVDPELLRISAVINKLKENGIIIERYNPNSAPQAFVGNKVINDLINQGGIGVLPITVVDNRVIKTKSYLTNEEVCKIFNLPNGFFKEVLKNINNGRTSKKKVVNKVSANKISYQNGKMNVRHLKENN